MPEHPDTLIWVAGIKPALGIVFFILLVKEVKSRESHLVFADDLKNLTKIIIIDNCTFISDN